MSRERVIATSIQLTPEMLDAADFIARKHKVSRTSLVRAALQYAIDHADEPWVTSREHVRKPGVRASKPAEQ
ncbi:MAG: hypothetical protein ACHREM_07745 [Polyangiales bacterium]